MSILRNDLQGKYCQIPNELIIDQRLSNGAFRVLCLLFSKPDNWKVYNKAIMNELGVKKPHTMADYWKECVDSGWLSRELITSSKEGTVGAYNYSINLLPIMGITADKGTAENGQLPKMGIHNKTNSTNKTDKSNTNSLPFCIKPTVWAEWVQHRKELKKALTPTTIKKQLAQLEKWDKLGMDTSEIIHASITNGWIGLFPLRNGMRQTNGNGTKNAQTTAEAYEAMKQEQNAHNGFIDTEVMK